MWRNRSAVEISVFLAIAGSLLAIAIPAFVRNLSASKLSEPVNALHRIVVGAVAHSEGRPIEISFPPSAPLTPADVPRGEPIEVDPNEWDHLTWRSLKFRVDGAQSFAYRFDSGFDGQRQMMRFVATAHGDLDGDGSLSTFQVRGERLAGQTTQVLPGLYVHREVE